MQAGCQWGIRAPPDCSEGRSAGAWDTGHMMMPRARGWKQLGHGCRVGGAGGLGWETTGQVGGLGMRGGAPQNGAGAELPKPDDRLTASSKRRYGKTLTNKIAQSEEGTWRKLPYHCKCRKPT